MSFKIHIFTVFFSVLQQSNTPVWTSSIQSESPSTTSIIATKSLQALTSSSPASSTTTSPSTTESTAVSLFTSPSTTALPSLSRTVPASSKSVDSHEVSTTTTSATLQSSIQIEALASSLQTPSRSLTSLQSSIQTEPLASSLPTRPSSTTTRTPSLTSSSSFELVSSIPATSGSYDFEIFNPAITSSSSSLILATSHPTSTILRSSVHDPTTSSRPLSTDSASSSTLVRSSTTTSLPPSLRTSPLSTVSSTVETNRSLASEFLIEVSSSETFTGDGKETGPFDDFSPREGNVIAEEDINLSKPKSEQNLTFERVTEPKSQIEQPNLAFDLSEPVAGFVRENRQKEKSTTMVDCGERTCQETYEELADCKLFVNDGEANCHVPCNLAGCEVVVRENVVCPVWHCTNKTGPSPTPGPSPPSPSPTSTSFCSDTVCISSVTGNFALLLFLAIIAVWFIKKRRRQAQLANWLLNDEEAGRRSEDGGDDRSIRTHSTTASTGTGIQNHGARNAVDGQQTTAANGGSAEPGQDDDGQQDDEPGVNPQTGSGATRFARCVQRHPLGLDANVLAEEDEEESIALSCFSSKKAPKSAAAN